MSQTLSIIVVHISIAINTTKNVKNVMMVSPLLLKNNLIRTYFYLLRRDAKIKDLQRRYNKLKAEHAADTKSFWQDYYQKDRQIKELQDGIDKLINEKNELAKGLQHSLADKNEKDVRQKVISECVDLVNQIYDFCKERNLKFSMDFVNDGKDPELFIWDSIGDSSICRVVYTSDWITTLKTILSRLKGSYKMCAEDKADCTVADVQHNESRPKGEHL